MGHDALPVDGPNLRIKYGPEAIFWLPDRDQDPQDEHRPCVLLRMTDSTQDLFFTFSYFRK
jgi:hypothetical protein